MVIICTLLGAAAPALRGFFISRKTHDAAARILSLTRLARSQAVSEARVHRVVFDADERTFHLAAEEQGSFRQPQTAMGRAHRLPDKVELELEVNGANAGRGYVAFFPDGRTEPATIRLTDLKGGLVVLECSGPTEEFVTQTSQEER